MGVEIGREAPENERSGRSKSEREVRLERRSFHRKLLRVMDWTTSTASAKPQRFSDASAAPHPHSPPGKRRFQLSRERRALSSDESDYRNLSSKGCWQLGREFGQPPRATNLRLGALAVADGNSSKDARQQKASEGAKNSCFSAATPDRSVPSVAVYNALQRLCPELFARRGSAT